MKHIITAILIITALLIGVSTVYAGPDIQDGLWEITSKMKMSGMPMEMPPVTFTQCMNSQDNVPYDADQNQDCTIKNSRIEGNTVSWNMQCSGRSGNMKSSGKITYSGSTFKGSVNAVAEGMEMTQTMSGRRIGDCK